MTVNPSASRLVALVLLLLVFRAPASPANAAATAETHPRGTTCGGAIDAVERARKFPAQLLQAVALVESGRWDRSRRARIAWPWTVRSVGGGRYFPTRQAAIAHVRDLQARGVRNIDVGCMQINLKYHPKAFADLDQAFDPQANAEYAGRLIDRLWRRTRSWSQAVRRYHTSDWKRGQAYWRRFFPIWNEQRHVASERQRLARIQAYRERLARLRAARR